MTDRRRTDQGGHGSAVPNVGLRQLTCRRHCLHVPDVRICPGAREEPCDLQPIPNDMGKPGPPDGPLAALQQAQLLAAGDPLCSEPPWGVRADGRLGQASVGEVWVYEAVQRNSRDKVRCLALGLLRQRHQLQQLPLLSGKFAIFLLKMLTLMKF